MQSAAFYISSFQTRDNQGNVWIWILSSFASGTRDTSPWEFCVFKPVVTCRYIEIQHGLMTPGQFFC